MVLDSVLGVVPDRVEDGCDVRAPHLLQSTISPYRITHKKCARGVPPCRITVDTFVPYHCTCIAIKPSGPYPRRNLQTISSYCISIDIFRDDEHRDVTMLDCRIVLDVYVVYHGGYLHTVSTFESAFRMCSGRHVFAGCEEHSVSLTCPHLPGTWSKFSSTLPSHNMWSEQQRNFDMLSPTP